MLVALILLIAADPSAPTLAQVEALPPAQAGELLLKGETHDRIVSSRVKVESGLVPPGWTQYELVEGPHRSPEGCVRRRWTATFSNLPDTTSDPKFKVAKASDEVALPLAGGCERASYAGVNTGLDKLRALKIMHVFHRITTGEVQASFACRSEIKGDLCASTGKTREHLREMPVWEVSQLSNVPELWLGRPGEGTVTIVRFDPDKPDHVSVTRKIPAPF